MLISLGSTVLNAVPESGRAAAAAAAAAAYRLWISSKEYIAICCDKHDEMNWVLWQ